MGEFLEKVSSWIRWTGGQSGNEGGYNEIRKHRVGIHVLRLRGRSVLRRIKRQVFMLLYF